MLTREMHNNVAELGTESSHNFGQWAIADHIIELYI